MHAYTFYMHMIRSALACTKLSVGSIPARFSSEETHVKVDSGSELLNKHLGNILPSKNVKMFWRLINTETETFRALCGTEGI